MNRIYFNNELIKEGDYINFKGLTVKVSSELIKNNSLFFTVLKYDLAYFEKILLSQDFYLILKELEPKLYYKKLLQIIADEFNKGEEPYYNSIKYLIGFTSRDNEKFEIICHNTVKYECTYFLRRQDASDALEIIKPYIKNILGC